MHTTPRIQIALVATTCLSLSNVAFGESLFQRLPEPGQWCRYSTVMLPIVEGAAGNSPEQYGSVTISALDIVDHEGKPHQWIEITNSIEVPTADAEEPDVVETLTAKCLIQRDQLQAGGDPLAHIARGWLKTTDAEIREADVGALTAGGQEAMILMFVMTRPLVDPTEVTVPNSARIEDEEFVTSEGVTGTLDTIELGEGGEFDGEFSYWTHDTVGFGVLASEFSLNTSRLIAPNRTLKMQIAVQLQIEAQDDGAVSKLPDHE